MKKYFIFIIALISIAFIGCTENQRARTFGGSMTVELPKGQKLMMATWKEDNLYYLLEPMEDNYTPKTKKFVESSSWGVLESTVTFIESR